MVVDKSGNFFIATASTIRKVSPGGIISTIAGLGTANLLGNPFNVDDSGNDGLALDATMQPRGIAVASDGTLYVSDGYTEQLRRITNDGMIDAYAGQYPKSPS